MLTQRFGFSVTGIDPVLRHIKAARASATVAGTVFELGSAERIPAGGGTVDLIWCRDVLVHVSDLEQAYTEFRRVLKPCGRVLVYQMFGAGQLEPREAVYAMIGKLTRRGYLLSSPDTA